jgi:hypothetical protein
MYKYIVTEDKTWADDSFNTVTYPTIIEVKELSGLVSAENHYLYSGEKEDMGKIYIEGILYNNPGEVPE